MFLSQLINRVPKLDYLGKNNKDLHFITTLHATTRWRLEHQRGHAVGPVHDGASVSHPLPLSPHQPPVRHFLHQGTTFSDFFSWILFLLKCFKDFFHEKNQYFHGKLYWCSVCHDVWKRMKMKIDHFVFWNLQILLKSSS